MRRIHGESNKSKEWNAWSSMVQRCTNPNDSRYYSHGARGITVCERWLHSYPNFLADMGRAPSKEYSLDRKDNDGNYEPSNCRWATRFEQANNRRSNVTVLYRGRTQTVKQWCEELNLPYSRTRARIRNGMHPERAFTETDNGHRIDSIIVTIDGKTKTLTEWSRELKIPYNTLKRKAVKEKLALLQLLG